MIRKVTSVQIRVSRIDFQFKEPARTSRNTLHRKPSWFIGLQDEEGFIAWGECSTIPGLSPDHEEHIEAHLAACVAKGALDLDEVPNDLPAVKFGVEQALRCWTNRSESVAFPGLFADGLKSIPINGLIWMEDPEGMLLQAEQLLRSGYETLKMKVGSLPFDREIAWLKELRGMAGPEVVLRADANGAFSKAEPNWTPLTKLEALAALNFHSIEQPLHARDEKALADLCAMSPVPIGLDESLIGVYGDDRQRLLDAIQPDYLILKPSLLGGFESSQGWLDLARQRSIGWWVTSALESNLGLYAIAQWVQDGVRSDGMQMPQGLGTGGLFQNNVPGTMEVVNGQLVNHPQRQWNLSSAIQP